MVTMSDLITDRQGSFEKNLLQHVSNEASQRCFNDVYERPPTRTGSRQKRPADSVTDAGTSVREASVTHHGAVTEASTSRENNKTAGHGLRTDVPVSSAEREFYRHPFASLLPPDGLSQAEKSLGQKRGSGVQEQVKAVEVGTIKGVYELGNGAIDLANLAVSPPMRLGNWLANTIKDQPTAIQDAANFGTDVGKALVSATRTEQALQKYLHQVQIAQKHGDYGKPVRDLQHGIESRGKRWEELTAAQKTEAITEQSVVWVTPVAAERVSGAALFQAARILPKQSVMDDVGQTTRQIAEWSKTAPEKARQAKQFLREYVQALGLSGPELERAGIPKVHFENAERNSFVAMVKADDHGDGIPLGNTKHSPDKPPRQPDGKEGLSKNWKNLDHEQAIDDYLKDHGHHVTHNLNEGKHGAGRQGDRFIDGILTEYKTLMRVQNITSDGLSKALSSRVMDARSQADNIIVDTRAQAGMTQKIAERGIKRAYVADDRKGAKIRSVRVIGNGFDITQVSE